jgi:hypothetical protein
MAERAWTIAAVLLLIVAGILLWRNNLSAAFVTATLGAVAWFLSYRSQLRGNIEQETEAEPDEERNEN